MIAKMESLFHHSKISCMIPELYVAFYPKGPCQLRNLVHYNSRVKGLTVHNNSHYSFLFSIHECNLRNSENKPTNNVNQNNDKLQTERFEMKLPHKIPLGTMRRV